MRVQINSFLGQPDTKSGKTDEKPSRYSFKIGSNPAYPTLWWTNWRDKLVEFSNMVRDEYKEERTLKTTGRKFFVVQRFRNLWKEMGFELYEDYSPKELQKFFPTKNGK